MANRARPRRGDRRSSLALAKKVLLSLIVVGLLGSVTYKRVYADLAANSTNPRSSVATGTLVVGDSVYTQGGTTLNAGTQCTSWSATTKNNDNAACSQLVLDPAPTGLLFPGQVEKAYVSIQNAGSLRANELQLSIPSCQTFDTLGTPAYVPASTGGTGNYCAGGLELYVQEVTDFSTDPPSNTRCVFPEDVYGTPATSCPWVQDGVAGLASVSCWDLGPMAANTTRYFVIGMQIDPVADNTLQGKTARFMLRWHLDGGANTYDVGGHPTGSSCVNAPLGIGQ